MKILITGATSGIGEALVERYAKAGWHVYACGRNAAKLDTLKQRIPAIESCCFDITNRDQIQQISESLPLLDLVILKRR